MATPAAETSATISTSPEQKKKTRLNPARRRAARTKSEVEGQTPAAANTNSPNRPQLRRVVTIETLSDEHSTFTASTQQPRPVPLSRQRTEPLLSPKQRSPFVTQTTQRTLTRTVTAPSATSKSSALAFTGPALVTGGLVGCAAGAAVLLGVQLWYDFNGAESAILAAKSAKLSMNNLTEELITSLKAGTYNADEALDILRRTTLAYASTIPEGAPFVERIFREIEMVRRQRGREVDKVVAETYAKLAEAGRQGASSVEMRDVVIVQLMKLSNFASNATQDIVARNPKLRPFKEETAKSLRGPRETGVPTVRVNMSVRQKQTIKE